MSTFWLKKFIVDLGMKQKHIPLFNDANRFFFSMCRR